MSDELMNTHATAESIQRMGQTASAQIVWTIAKALVTTFVVGSIAMATGYVKDIRDDTRVVAQKVEVQDKALALTAQKVESLQLVSTQTVATLQQMAIQINDNRYDIRTLKEREAEPEKGSR